MSERIFVEIAAYRDMELRNTVESAMSAAEHPEDLTFGIIQQCGDEDRKLLDDYASDKRFRIVKMDWRDCRGVGEARAMSETLYDDEEYVLQIDAHMMFGKGWDTMLKQQWRRCGDGRAVLSTYPAPYWYDEKGIKYVRKVVPGYRIEVDAKENSTVFISQAVIVPEELRSNMKRTLYVVGGLEFFPGAVLDRIKYIKEIAFNGEEIARSAQFFTHGYNIYIPVGVPIYHHYGRKGAHRYWGDMADGEDETLKKIYDKILSKSQRVRGAMLKGGEVDFLGKDRSLKVFLELTKNSAQYVD